ncbi:MAG: cupin domain-containing protein [Chloroflexota bacterium]|nr:cupin domain-containing protein [Chloroflexota bacterium]
MKTTNLMEGIQFGDKDAHAEPLYVDKHGRAIRFTLKPGQAIKEHNAPNSPFYVVVLKGQGMFAGGDGKETPCGPNALLIFDPKENHVIRALDEELVFVGFLHGASSNVSEKKGGKLGRKRK